MFRDYLINIKHKLVKELSIKKYYIKKLNFFFSIVVFFNIPNRL